MECLIINVAAAQARMAFMAEQMDALGLSYERLDAVTPDKAAPARDQTYWNSWERPLKDTEKACFLSHVAAWAKVAEQNRPFLILEDDVLLSRHVPDLLATAQSADWMDHMSLEVRKRRKLVGKAPIRMSDGLDAYRLYQDRSGAAAYVLWPSGAAKLLARSERQAALADAMICKAYELETYQVEPACAVQLDRAEAYGILPPVKTQSLIDAGKRPQDAARSLTFRTRRIAAQLRMGLRALANSRRAERREIALNPGDFSKTDG